MTVEVINTGSELLLGNVLNRHLAYLGQQLLKLGLRISRQTTVPDGADIRSALIEAFPRSDIVIVTGGLGPTTDDITREITAELLSLHLAEDPAVLKSIAHRLGRRRIPFQPRMHRQAMVPEGATVLQNDNGTAPGLYIPSKSSPSSSIPHLFLLPGPPRELIPMFEYYAWPIIKKIVGPPPDFECRIYNIVGLGESLVEERVGLALHARGDIEVGYCARPNEVDLRLIGPRAVLDEVEPQIAAAMGDFLASRDAESLEQIVVGQLRKRGATLAVAESCSGGLLAHRITNVPGASEVFLEGFVTYANRAKAGTLKVPEVLIRTHGAVSEPVAREMAEGAVRRSKADYALSLTGIAGPGGGTKEKPVGTVYIALAESGQPTECIRVYFPTDRETFKQLATQSALDLLRRRMARS